MYQFQIDLDNAFFVIHKHDVIFNKTVTKLATILTKC